MANFLLKIFLLIGACAPMTLLVFDLAHRYPLDTPLTDIALVDGVLLIAALVLPVLLLPRLGVDWRREPDEY